MNEALLAYREIISSRKEESVPDNDLWELCKLAESEKRFDVAARLCRRIANSIHRLQRIAFEKFQPELRVFALSNIRSVEGQTELKMFLMALEDEKVTCVCQSYVCTRVLLRIKKIAVVSHYLLLICVCVLHAGTRTGLRARAYRRR